MIEQETLRLVENTGKTITKERRKSAKILKGQVNLKSYSWNNNNQ